MFRKSYDVIFNKLIVMSARTYMPFIEWAMTHVERVYSWNKRVDEMRIAYIKERELEPPRWVLIESSDDYHKYKWYNFNDGLRMYYEERNEYTTAKLNNDKEEMVDAVIDQFVVAIWEIRKCALSDNYERIMFWEDEANNAYGTIDGICFDIAEARFSSDEPVAYADVSKLGDEILNACITEVLDALDTRFWDDAYIDENGKFIKSNSYRKPDLSFLTKK